jgi:hypothetical protein
MDLAVSHTVIYNQRAHAPQVTTAEGNLCSVAILQISSLRDG